MAKNLKRTAWDLWRIADVQASSMDIPVHHQLRKAISYVSLATTPQLKKPPKPRPQEAYRMGHLETEWGRYAAALSFKSRPIFIAFSTMISCWSA